MTLGYVWVYIVADGAIRVTTIAAYRAMRDVPAHAIVTGSRAKALRVLARQLERMGRAN